MVGEADSELTLLVSSCHIGKANSANPGHWSTVGYSRNIVRSYNPTPVPVGLAEWIERPLLMLWVQGSNPNLSENDISLLQSPIGSPRAEEPGILTDL